MLKISKKLTSVAFGTALVVSAVSAQAAETFSFDKGHTEINFAYNHVGMSTQSGTFDDYDGTVTIDFEKPENSQIDVVIKSASIDTNVEELDAHLSSGDFFDAAKFPEITFKSTKVVQTGKNFYAVTGDLTIKDTTKPVTLQATLNHHGDHPLAAFVPSYAGAPYVAFSAKGSILRSDFGVGGFAPLTSDVVTLNIETEMRRAE
ncbi:YceI family protein [Kiloniella laminariae]|uniref:YceI family protein n=1 Tax=Kiloniella laminariae TaxID=454162 RepID=A0ABT4LE32_9PROT|nr:YceI family protein [Kiloniella laminariae]MCZ4279180.1 YceI family protein [Kiloniella laminariae]